MKTNGSKELLKAYSRVFSPTGEILPCGRENCKLLIAACQSESQEASLHFGNPETGFLNVENVKSLIAKLHPEIVFKELYLKVFNSYGHPLPDSIDNKELLTDLLVSAANVDSTFSTMWNFPIDIKFTPELANELTRIYNHLFSKG